MNLRELPKKQIFTVLAETLDISRKWKWNLRRIFCNKTGTTCNFYFYRGARKYVRCSTISTDWIRICSRGIEHLLQIRKPKLLVFTVEIGTFIQRHVSQVFSITLCHFSVSGIQGYPASAQSSRTCSAESIASISFAVRTRGIVVNLETSKLCLCFQTMGRFGLSLTTRAAEITLPKSSTRSVVSPKYSRLFSYFLGLFRQVPYELNRWKCKWDCC